MSSDLDFITTGGKKTLWSCSYCKRDITQQFRARCVECSCSTNDCPFELCADCFAVGINATPHSNEHSYRIVDCLDGPIFTYDWSAAEELLLLEGIDKHGVGNWKVIADYMSTMKTTSQIESHYWEIYMGRHGYCLPEYTLDNGVHVRTETLLPDGDAKQGMLTKLISDHTLGEEVVRDKGKDQSFKDTVVRGGREKVQEAQIRERIAQMPGAELPGYMPLRGDFDYEYENDGEVLLADMEFDDNDHPSERELKLQVVRIYNKKLDERDSRKKFVIERGIVDFKQQQGMEKKKTKDERDLAARLKIFARFHAPEEHEALVTGLLQARKLRGQIELYQNYRKLGIRSLEEAREYEIDRKKREEELKSEKHRKDAGYIFETGRGQVGKPSTSRRSRLEDEGLPPSKKQKDCKALVLSTAPLADMLTDKELALCQSIPMLPSHYLAVKEAIVREMYRNGQLTKEGITRVTKLDPETADGKKIYDFFVHEVKIQ